MKKLLTLLSLLTLSCDPREENPTPREIYLPQGEMLVAASCTHYSCPHVLTRPWAEGDLCGVYYFYDPTDTRGYRYTIYETPPKSAAVNPTPTK